jgi:class III poly(R)-hydroxyalkanoic acid synthase PhaE subunit
MGEAGKGSEDWVQGWIDQQRERLRNSGTNDADTSRPSDEFQTLAAKWLAVGQSMWNGSEQLLAGLGSSGAPLGWGRESEQDWRELVQSQAEYVRFEAEWLTIIGQVQSDALSQLERTIRERGVADSAIKDARELYDLWIECGEQVYAKAAHSERFCNVQAALGNAATRLRASQQKIIERGLKQFDLPTRSEINSLHRQVRDLRERLDKTESETRGSPIATSSRKAKPSSRKPENSAKKRAGRGSRKR